MRLRLVRALLPRLASASGSDGRRRVLRGKSRTPPTTLSSPRNPHSSSLEGRSSRGLLCTVWVVPPRRVGCRGFHCSERGGVGAYWDGLNLAFLLMSLLLLILQYNYLSYCLVSHVVVLTVFAPVPVTFLTVLALLSDDTSLASAVFPRRRSRFSSPSGRGNSGPGVPEAVSRPCQPREESGHRGRMGDSGSGTVIWVASVEFEYAGLRCSGSLRVCGRQESLVRGQTLRSSRARIIMVVNLWSSRAFPQLSFLCRRSRLDGSRVSPALQPRCSGAGC